MREVMMYECILCGHEAHFQIDDHRRQSDLDGWMVVDGSDVCNHTTCYRVARIYKMCGGRNFFSYVEGFKTLCYRARHDGTWSVENELGILELLDRSLCEWSTL